MSHPRPQGWAGASHEHSRDTGTSPRTTHLGHSRPRNLRRRASSVSPPQPGKRRGSPPGGQGPPRCITVEDRHPPRVTVEEGNEGYLALSGCGGPRRSSLSDVRGQGPSLRPGEDGDAPRHNCRRQDFSRRNPNPAGENGGYFTLTDGRGPSAPSDGTQGLYPLAVEEFLTRPSADSPREPRVASACRSCWRDC